MSKNKPVIGVMPLVDYEKSSYWMLPGYLEGIAEAGGIPVVLPLADGRDDIAQLAEAVNGFLFTGGQDVSPLLYGEEPIAQCGESCRARDAAEIALLEEAIRLDKPLLGICRGIQLINAALGGSLYQDLPLQHPSGTEHHQNPPYDIPVHGVNIIEGSGLHSLLGVSSLRVNSYHHQAIKRLSDKLEAMAYSEDGLVEAVRLPGKKFIWAVQWHPEYNHKVSEESRKLFKALITAAKIN